MILLLDDEFGAAPILTTPLIDDDDVPPVGCPCGLALPHPADGSPCWHPVRNPG